MKDLHSILLRLDFEQRIGGDASPDITGVEATSSRCVPGSLFCCIPGSRRDGHDFADDAVDRGAAAVLCERPLDVAVPQVVVGRGTVRTAVAEVAAAFYDRPGDRLVTVGVTGTNGKTTVTHMVSSIFEAHGWRSTVIGTLSGPMTTPDAPDLQKMLWERAESGDHAVAMEVSSHGMANHRVDGFCFDVGVFTNLGHDHLDYHHTMDEYFAAKAALFTPEHVRSAVVNVDDPWGRRLADGIDVPLRTYSLGDVEDLDVEAGRSVFRLDGEAVRLSMTGGFNVANAVAAARAAGLVGVPVSDACRGLEKLPGVPGRLEQIVHGEGPAVYVDFAHTPEALEAAIGALRPLSAGGRLVVVFGCGGDRDRTKRPEMGAVAARGADIVVVTSDNPRSEDTKVIVAEIVAGTASGGADVVVEIDRARAIERAIGAAGPDGTVLVAGKGHEKGQEIAGRILEFDDRDVSARWLGRARTAEAGRRGGEGRT